jgi:ABC-type glutathione transport system ATPase component
MRGVSRRGERPITAGAQAAPVSATSHLLRIHNMTKTFPDGGGAVTVFESATLEMRAASQVGVYGKRRSGKSTLLRIASGIEPPDEGTVLFQGEDLTCLTGTERARLLRSRLAYIAVADWRPNPGESILQHLAVSLGGAGPTVREAEHRALRELETVGVSAAQAHSLATRLSMMDRMRVMFARALAREPSLLVIDDPVVTASASERDELYLLLRTLTRRRGIGLLVASDDLPALQGFDVFMSISAREICSSEGSATIVPFPSPPSLGPVSTGS